MDEVITKYTKHHPSQIWVLVTAPKTQKQILFFTVNSSTITAGMEALQ